ncbi:MAG TPA: hypothetical protein VLM05_00845 [Mycobacteriales bacterium]|nr:hypothetical protein [Mycobacteriales bacterium]
MLTRADVACWLLKTARPVDAGWAPGTTRVLDRCLRPSYRLGLMAPSDPCLLWLSGRQAGVVALGTVTEPPDPAGPPEVRVTLRRLPDPVPRAALLPTPFATAEVIRMPFGSNPSWLSHPQLATVLDAVS